MIAIIRRKSPGKKLSPIMKIVRVVCFRFKIVAMSSGEKLTRGWSPTGLETTRTRCAMPIGEETKVKSLWHRERKMGNWSRILGSWSVYNLRRGWWMCYVMDNWTFTGPDYATWVPHLLIDGFREWNFDIEPWRNFFKSNLFFSLVMQDAAKSWIAP